jgi:Domain of unknown function (DUF3806)
MKLTEDEKVWVEAQLEAAERFVADYGSGRGGAGLAALDHAWASWLDRQSVDPEDPDAIINAVAVALGQALVDAVDEFVWVTVYQDGDTDLGVSGLPALDVLIFPADLVAKEYEAKAQTFLERTRDTLVAEVAEIRS